MYGFLLLGHFTAARLTLRPIDPAVMAAVAASAPAPETAATATTAAAAAAAGVTDAGGDAEAAAAAQAAAAAVAAQGCFQVLLPLPQLCSSDFVLLQSRFQASLASSWQVGDRVQVSSS